MSVVQRDRLWPGARTTDRVLDDLDNQQRPSCTAVPTGFDPLDSVLGGGFRPEELAIVGGRPGVGKTIALLQFARAAARSGHPVAVASYEHSADAMVRRLIASEVALGTGSSLDVPTMIAIRRAVADHTAGRIDRATLASIHPAVADALARLRRDGPFLSLLRASSESTDLAALARFAAEHAEPGGVLVVDHLQKVARGRDSRGDASGEIATALKELAYSQGLVVVAAVATSDAGMSGRRLHLAGLWGSAAVAHEADVAILLNEKSDVVSHLHGAFDTTLLAGYRHRVVLTVEKHRDGPAPVHLEFTKQFADFRFDQRGRFVTEQIIDDGLVSS